MNKRTVLALCVAMAIPIPALAACNKATLQGAYAWSLSELDYNINAPSYFLGRFVFDGAGKLSGGPVFATQASPPLVLTATGSYTLGANCVGTMQITLKSAGTPISEASMRFIVSGSADDPQVSVIGGDSLSSTSITGGLRKINQ